MQVLNPILGVHVVKANDSKALLNFAVLVLLFFISLSHACNHIIVLKPHDALINTSSINAKTLLVSLI